ncbi:MAG: hypothetical protein H0X25_01570, partial [Acidobacteriales bacterium]|nr:hypothetical protein [Terriglobales bacterium]
MKVRLHFAAKAAALTILTTVIFVVAIPASATEKVLFTFTGSDGQAPDASLTFDQTGSLYGTTSQGGVHGYGTVFKLSPGANGTWTETVLHSFDSTDGANPEGSLIFDSAGNLYGTTSQGGATYGNGTVFELSPGANGNWTETVLYSLDGLNGSQPFGSLTFDAQGNLYGTAWQGGDSFSGGCIYGGCGTVFEVSPGSNGNWTGKAIYVFNGKDGSAPFSNLVFDKAGNLYGTTTGLFSNYLGTVFRLTPGANGEWSETILYTFNDSGGDQLYAGLVFDTAGNLYGTTWSGGAHALGSVFELAPGKNGKWAKTVLHSFNGKDGSFAYAGVVFDATGNLWGTTSGYGSDLGSVYELIPGSNRQWTIKVLQTFHDIEVNGGVVFDARGNLYSTAFHGGNTPLAIRAAARPLRLRRKTQERHSNRFAPLVVLKGAAPATRVRHPGDFS